MNMRTIFCARIFFFITILRLVDPFIKKFYNFAP